MSQRGILILAAVLTAFSLVVVGAAAGGLFAVPAPASTATVEPPQSTPAAIPAAVVAQREEAWRKLVDEANARLAEQQKALATLRPLGAKNEPVVPSLAAIVVARACSPGAEPVRAPELVSYQGVEAWEVVLGTGTVYVDAVTAMVLHDGTVKAAPRLRQRDGDDDEHHRRQAYARREHHEEDEGDDD